jgi:hypothetical protein
MNGMLKMNEEKKEKSKGEKDGGQKKKPCSSGNSAVLCPW